jgi:hypothetical protein
VRVRRQAELAPARQYTVSNIDGNTASTSNNDIFGVFTIC